MTARLLTVGRIGPLADRLFVGLEWDGDCLLWRGYVQNTGYGRITERVDGRRRDHLVHRLLYALTVGEVPPHLYVLHSCDTPLCCNPEHLRLGTHAENMADRASRGRTFNGRTSVTHCPRQHPYDEGNTIRTNRGSRECRTCRALYRGQRRPAVRAAA